MIPRSLPKIYPKEQGLVLKQCYPLQKHQATPADGGKLASQAVFVAVSHLLLEWHISIQYLLVQREQQKHGAHPSRPLIPVQSTAGFFPRRATRSRPMRSGSKEPDAVNVHLVLWRG